MSLRISNNWFLIDFIYKNWDKRNEFFILLENPDASRCDVYHKQTNSYFIVNTDMKTNKLLNASRDYWNKKYSNVLRKEDEFKCFGDFSESYSCFCISFI